MRKLLPLIICILLSIQTPIFAEPQLNKQEKFRIGAILPLSGRSADYGVAAKNGIELAKKEKPGLL